MVVCHDGCGHLPAKTQESLRACLERWLKSPEAAELQDEEDFVDVQSALQACKELRLLAGGSTQAVAEAVRSRPTGALACNDGGTAVKYCGLLQRVQLAAEACVAASSGGRVRTLQLLGHPDVRQQLSVVHEAAARVRVLLEAVGQSTLIAEHDGGISLRRCLEEDLVPWSDRDRQYAPPPAPHPPPCVIFHPLYQEVQKDTPKVEPEVHDNTEAVDLGGSGLRSTTRQRICQAVQWHLEHQSPSLRKATLADGSIEVAALWEASPNLQALCFNRPSALITAVSKGLRHRVVADVQQETVRLLPWHDRVCSLTEAHLRGMLATSASAGPASSLSELAAVPELRSVLSTLAGSRRCRPHPEASLKLALRASDMFILQEEEEETWVVLRPPEALLCAAVETLLDSDVRAQKLLESEGEVPLSWIVERSEVKSALERVGMHANLEVALEALRAAVQTKSVRYRLDGNGPRASVCSSLPGFAASPGRPRVQAEDFSQRARSSSPANPRSPQQTLLLPDVLPSTAAGCDPLHLPKGAEHSKFEVASGPHPARGSHVKQLRLLLAFYFETFNIQHNRLLMYLAQARAGDPSPHAPGHWPSKCLRFSVHDLLALPRLGRLLAGRNNEPRIQLLEQAISKDLEQPDPALVPMRVAWCHGKAYLELASPVKLRLLELVQPRLPPKQSKGEDRMRTICRLCPDLEPLVNFSTSSLGSSVPMPPHVLLLVSYSVSSDLSHSQSPKATAALEAVYDSQLKAHALDWDSRLQRLRRQLLYYNADIVCLQAIQSVGFTERCSEENPQWFSLEDEPSANHLVHLYRGLNKANYGVAWAPTMISPGSATISFGNAVFWRRSRWRLERHFQLCDSAVCVQLSPRGGGSSILVCSTKTAASYALEWGDRPSTEELLHPIRAVAEGLGQETAGVARALWCGDFGCKPTLLRDGVSRRHQSSVHASYGPWESAYLALDQDSPGFAAASPSGFATGEQPIRHDLQSEPWTSASLYSSGLTTDHILSQGVGELLAVLGSWPGPPNATELLELGFPSDHLLLLAVYRTSQGPAAAHCTDPKRTAGRRHTRARPRPKRRAGSPGGAAQPGF